MNEKYIFIHGIEKNFVSRGVKAGGIKRGIPQIGNVKKKKRPREREKGKRERDYIFCGIHEVRH